MASELVPASSAHDGEDQADRRVAERRLKMYAPEALTRTVQLDKALVKHRSFQESLTALDRIFQLGKHLQNVPVGLRVIGLPGTGKSTLLRYFVESLPRSDLFERGMGVVAIRLERRATLVDLVEGLLRELRYPLAGTNYRNVVQRRDVLMEMLARRNTHAILIDEAHRLCVRPITWAAASDEGSDATAFICQLIDARIGVALCGGPGLERLREFDRYLHSRCTSAVTLQNFAPGAAWRGLVKQLIVECSAHSLRCFEEAEQLAKLHNATDGNLRAVKMLLVEAVLVSADACRSAVTAEDLERACDLVRDEVAGANPWSKK